jgi:type I restriction enzyme S subunit
MAGEIDVCANWPNVRLGNFVRNFDSKRIPLSSRERLKRQGTYPYYGAAGCIDFIDDYLFEGLHLLVGEDGSVLKVNGTPFLQLVAGKFWVNNHAHVLRGNDEVETRYAYYALSDFNISGLVTGAVQLKLTQANLNSIELSCPPRSIMEGIVDVLGTLDDLIELNRETNEILEEMARALFKSWFVDFDPVRAKLEGRPPAGMDAATAALFPDHFQDSELGQIPKGWEVKPVGHIAEQSIGGQWGDDLPVEDLVPAICLRGCDMEDLRKSGFSARAPTRFIKPQALEKRAMDDCDFLIASSGAGPCGRPLWCSPDLQKMHQHPVIYSNFVKRFTTPSRAHAIFLDRLFQEKFTNGSIWDYINGTSVPNLDAQGLLSGHKFVLPPVAILKAFAAYCGPVFELLYSGESRDLATLRDTLLPKLLSGEVSAPAAEELIAAST